MNSRSMPPRFMWSKMESRVLDRNGTRRGLIRITTIRVTRRQMWFVGNATNRAIRRETIQFGSISID